jgi:RNA polymerase sigma-B factor
MHAPSPTTRLAASARATNADQDRRAGELVVTLAALPIRHPGYPDLRHQTIQAWTPMARRLARRYEGRGEPMDDLVQTAIEGLIKAVDRFDPSHGVDYVAFAIPTILGELKRFFRDHSWMIRVPRRLQEMRLAINEANSVLVHLLGHTPTVGEIAGYLRVGEEEVLEGLEGARAYSATSLSAPAGAEGTLKIGDTFGGPDHGYELTEVHLVLAPALLRLSERDRRIVMLRFFGNQTQTQIAEQVGVSQMHISRIIAKALARMREDIAPGVE